MYKILCSKCHGTGGYERPCQCFADDDCPKCHGKGYFWRRCSKCGGAGMVSLKRNELNNNDMTLK